MKFFKKIYILFLIIVITITTCLFSSCSLIKREVISAEKAISIVTEYSNTIKSYMENAGYVFDNDSYIVEPQLFVDEDTQRRHVYSSYDFNGDGVNFSTSVYLDLTEKKVDIGCELRTNKNPLENNQISNDIQTMLAVINLVSEKQFTADEYVDFLTNDEYIHKPEEYEVQYRWNFFDFWGDICFYFYEYKEYDDKKISTNPRYKHWVNSLSKKIV